MILISWAKVENDFLVRSLTLTFTSVINEIMSQAKSLESFCLEFYVNVFLVLLKQKSDNLKIFNGL